MKTVKILALLLAAVLLLGLATACDDKDTPPVTATEEATQGPDETSAPTGTPEATSDAENMPEKKATPEPTPAELNVQVAWFGTFLADSNLLSTSDSDTLFADPKSKGRVLSMNYGEPLQKRTGTVYFDENKKIIPDTDGKEEKWDDEKGCFTIGGVPFDTYHRTITAVYDLEQCEAALKKKYSTSYSLKAEKQEQIADYYDLFDHHFMFSINEKNHFVVIEDYNWIGAMGAGPFPYAEQTGWEKKGDSQAVAHLKIINEEEAVTLGTLDVLCDVSGTDYAIKSWTWEPQK